MSSAENLQITVEENEISWHWAANVTVITTNAIGLNERVIVAIVGRHNTQNTSSATQLSAKTSLIVLCDTNVTSIYVRSHHDVSFTRNSIHTRKQFAVDL